MQTPHFFSKILYQPKYANGGGSRSRYFGVGRGLKQYAPIAALPVALLATAFASHSLTPVYQSHAEDLTAVVDSTGYFVNLSSISSGEVNLAVNTTTAGNVAIAEDALNIKSNAPNGYALYLAMEGADNKLYKDGNTASSAYFVPTSGTWAAPQALDTNAWGYALASGTPGVPSNNFSSGYSTSVPDAGSVFAGVPVKGQDQLIQVVDTPDETAGVNTTIYYGVNANTAMLSGSYKGTVTYTAISRVSVASQDTASVSPSVTTKLDGGEELTIVTNLQIDPATVELDNTTGTNLTEDGVDLSVELMVGGVACTDKTFSRAEDNSLKINCLAPAHATGKYDVYIRIPKYSKVYTIVNGLTYSYTQSDLDDALADQIGTVTGGDATPSDILLDKVAYINGVSVTGTMPNNGAISETIGVGESFTIPAGYHNGSGTVSFAGTAEAVSVTANASTGSQTYDVTAGYYDQVIVDQTAVYNAGYSAGRSSVNLIYLGTTLPVNVTAISQDYTKLTVNNFLCVNPTASASSNYNVSTAGGAGAYVGKTAASYNASTGVFNVVVTQSGAVGGWGTGTISASCSRVYLVDIPNWNGIP